MKLFLSIVSIVSHSFCFGQNLEKREVLTSEETELGEVSFFEKNSDGVVQSYVWSWNDTIDGIAYSYSEDFERDKYWTFSRSILYKQKSNKKGNRNTSFYKPDGEYYRYNQQGDVTSIEIYEMGKATEFSTHYEYFSWGDLSQKTEYKGKQPHGIMEAYYQSGQFWYKIRNEEGKLAEIIEYYAPDGKPMDHSTFKEGNGSIATYNDCGDYTGVVNYENGVLVEDSRQSSVDSR